MNLSLPGVDTARDLPPDAERQRSLSQWFTPDALALRMARWCGRLPSARILEPSAGSGALVNAACVAFTAPRIDAVEIDPQWAARISSRFYDEPVTVLRADYIAFASPSALESPRYTLGLANPPYENGLDGLFLEKMMRECDRIVALIRVVALCGKDRHERVWGAVESHVDGWWMPGLAPLSSRPSFLAAGEASESAKSDFCVVKLSRLGKPGPTRVEWWT